MNLYSKKAAPDGSREAAAEAASKRKSLNQ